MIDYNEFLSDEEKLTVLQEKIEVEKSKMSKALQLEKRINKRLQIMEDYYDSLRSINDKHIEKPDAPVVIDENSSENL